MVTKVELQILLLNFLKRMEVYKAKDAELKQHRAEFERLFPKDDILNISIERYVTGNKSNESFCYLLERKLKELGSILGGPVWKFKVYYSDKSNRYESTKDYSLDYKIAFQKVKQEIHNLLLAHQDGNKQRVKDINLSVMFKGKILATYFPDECLNIFTKEHLNYFLEMLRINYNIEADEIDKRELLMEFKRNNEEMKKWSTYLFMKFLYTEIGDPRKTENIPVELQEYNDLSSDYPDLRKIKPEIIKLEILESDKGKTSKTRQIKKIDFEEENRRKRILGFRGEKIVEKHERDILIKNGKSNLAERVNIASIEDDSLGYDILSYDFNGRKKYIEVKSTMRSPSSQIQFNISYNQIEVAKQLENYYIYVVFEAKTNKPKIWPIFNPFKDKNSKIILKPVSYKVIINVDELELNP